MTLDDLITHTRHNLLRDFSTPPLWSDDTILMYINQAVERVARLTHSFVPEARELDITANEDFYTLEDDVVFVYSIRLDGLATRLQPSTDGWTPHDGLVTTPTRYSLDSESMTIRFYPIPDMAYTALMRVAVLPPVLTDSDRNSELPVRRQYQLALGDWVAYKCFTHDDADGRNDAAADRALLRFREAIGETKRENYRLQTGANPRVHGQRVK